MTIKVGDRVPDATLTEFIETETAGCTLGPNNFQVADLVKGKKILMFALPGAFTPTCSAKHVPSYVEHNAAIKAKGVDAVAVTSVNDAFVMGAWAKSSDCDGKIEFLADGSAKFAQAIGLGLDLTERGMGMRSRRYSMLVEDGVVKTLNVEEGTGAEASGALTMLGQL